MPKQTVSLAHATRWMWSRLRFDSLVDTPTMPLLSDRHKLAVLFTPKAGCSSVVKWFLELHGKREEAARYDSWVHRYRSEVFNKSWAYTRARVHYSPAHYRHIKVVRNPYTRVVSSYIHSLRRPMICHAEMASFLQRPVVGRGYSFREFVGFLETVDLGGCNPHLGVQVKEKERQGRTIDRILRLEDGLERQLGEVSHALGLPVVEFDRLNLSGSSHHVAYEDTTDSNADTLFDLETDRFTPISMPHWRSFYGEGLQEKVYALFRADFDQYTYASDLPQ